jgi:hypothetical protein
MCTVVSFFAEEEKKRSREERRRNSIFVSIMNIDLRFILSFKYLVRKIEFFDWYMTLKKPIIESFPLFWIHHHRLEKRKRLEKCLFSWEEINNCIYCCYFKTFIRVKKTIRNVDDDEDVMSNRIEKWISMHARMNVIRFSRIVMIIKKKGRKRKWNENNKIGNLNLWGTITNIYMLT